MRRLLGKLFESLLTVCVVVAFCVCAQAQPFPSRPVRMLLGFAAGGSTDAVARYYAQKLTEELKVPVIVENKPGGQQVVAIKTMMAAQADGYTLYLGTGSSLSQGPGVRTDLPYDPLKDFALVGLVATTPGVILVSADLPVRSVSELVAYSKANPGKLNYGSSGVGSASHLQIEYLKHLAGIEMTHVPYRADAEIITAIYTGTVHVGMTPMQGSISPLATGKVRALAVTTSRRLDGLPDVATLSESNIQGLERLDPYTYYGLAGPVGLSPAIVAQLNNAINKISSMPEAITYLREKVYFEPGTGSPDDLRKFIKDDISKWRAFSKQVKLPG